TRRPRTRPGTDAHGEWPMPRTVTLTERVPRVVRLRRADADFLLARHRAHVEVLPTTERGRYRLTALGVVGSVVAPTVRLWVRPKLPAVNLFHLLDPAAPPPEVPDHAGPAGLLSFLAGRFADRLAERVTAGLERDLAGDGRHRVAAQESFIVNRPAAGLPDLTLRPDVTLTRDGRPVVVLDVKWKRLGDVPSSDDLHQVLAYAAALGAPR